MSQILLIATAGIAAGATIVQLTDVSGWSKITIGISFILFATSLISGVFGLTTLLGQATEESPDIHSGLVRWPNLISMVALIIGVAFFTAGASGYFLSKKKNEAMKTKRCPDVVLTPNVKSDSDIKIPLNREQKLLLNYFIERAFKNEKCDKPKPAGKKKQLKKQEPPKKIQ